MVTPGAASLTTFRLNAPEAGRTILYEWLGSKRSVGSVTVRAALNAVLKTFVVGSM